MGHSAVHSSLHEDQLDDWHSEAKSPGIDPFICASLPKAMCR